METGHRFVEEIIQNFENNCDFLVCRRGHYLTSYLRNNEKYVCTSPLMKMSVYAAAHTSGVFVPGQEDLYYYILKEKH